MSTRRTHITTWICDQCLKEMVDTYNPNMEGVTDFENHNLVPYGWYKLNFRYDGQHMSTHHFCSIECIRRFSDKPPAADSAR